MNRARRGCGFSTKIEVECRSLTEALTACKSGADVVMLDNYSPEDAKADALEVKKAYPGIFVEVSGGITEDTFTRYLGEAVDVVSVGKLTQGYACIDFSLKIQKN